MPLTERGIRALAPKAQRYDITDDGQYGRGNLRLRVSPNGRKAFYGVAQIDGKRHTQKLGDYPEMSLAVARERLDAWVTEQSAMHSQEGEGAAIELSFGQAFSLYMEMYARPRKKTAHEDERRWRKHLSHLNELPVCEVNRVALLEVLDGIMRRGAEVEANRVFEVMHKAFAWFLERGWIPYSPLQGVRKPAQETPKERVLSQEEICDFWRSTQADAPIPQLLRGILQTGLRPGELRLLRWEYQENDGFLLPAKTTKTGKPHWVPATPYFLATLPARGESPWVFPGNADGTPLSITSLPQYMRRLSARHGWEDAATAHDLRRTAITHMAEMGVPELVLAAIANHAVPGITRRVYNRYSYDKEKREALEAWQERLAGWVVGRKMSAEMAET